MTRNVITVNRQTTMHELAVLFDKHDFNAFPVVEDGKLCGIISKFDFLHAFAFTTSQVVPHYNELMNRTTRGDDRGCSACRPGITINAGSPKLMVGLKTRSFPVMSADGQLEGMISREDVMRALKETTRG